ncbi:MAG: flagellar basal body P-ring protein FlgI [Ignavibacteria bacterium]|nr:flagellar basal body P-ring protein FlgI [Ignavibacteria bacterium]
MMKIIQPAVLVLLWLLLCSARIKDVGRVEGLTGVQVIGYGLVSGLNNTGDNQLASHTVQSVVNMLKRFGLTVPNLNPRIRNVAAVMVTATIPTFSKKGSKVDVVVSSIGDATTLQGGVLLLTPMSLSDGTIIGFAQGPLSVGGYEFTANGARVAKNFVTSARVPNGLILEKDIEAKFFDNQQIRIILNEPDFTTSFRVASTINRLPRLANSAVALDASTIQVSLPSGISQQEIMSLISQIELAEVERDSPARVVINERTGTIVVGGNVQINPVVIAHSGLEIAVQKEVVFPPQAVIALYLNRGMPFDSIMKIIVREQVAPSVALDIRAPTVQDIANALNLLNVSPRDLISIFQALKESGALQAELIIQ